MGASYQEMVDDYMKTYENYYNITNQTGPKLFAILDYSGYAKDYLLAIGMKEEDINKLIERLSR